MNTCKKAFFICLLLCSLFCCSFATENQQSSITADTTLQENNITEIDSVAIYESLIVSYDNQTKGYTLNIIGYHLGFPFYGFAISSFIIPIALLSTGSLILGIAGTLALGAVCIIGIPLYIAGIFIFKHNAEEYEDYQFFVKHRDEYKEALERYKQKQHSVEAAITPVTNNLAGSSIGINAILRF